MSSFLDLLSSFFFFSKKKKATRATAADTLAARVRTTPTNFEESKGWKKKKLLYIKIQFITFRVACEQQTHFRSSLLSLRRLPLGLQFLKNIVV